MRQRRLRGAAGGKGAATTRFPVPLPKGFGAQRCLVWASPSEGVGSAEGGARGGHRHPMQHPAQGGPTPQRSQPKQAPSREGRGWGGEVTHPRSRRRLVAKLGWPSTLPQGVGLQPPPPHGAALPAPCGWGLAGPQSPAAPSALRALPALLGAVLGGWNWPCPSVPALSPRASSVALGWGAGGGRGGGHISQNREVSWWGGCRRGRCQGGGSSPAAGRKRSQGWVSRRGCARSRRPRWNLPPAAQAPASLFSVSLLLLVNSPLPFRPCCS